MVENSFKNVRLSLANAKILDTSVSWQHFCEKINDLILDNKNKLASSEDKRLGVYFVHENDLKYDNRFDYLSTNLFDKYSELLDAERDFTITEYQKLELKHMRETLKQNLKFAEKVIKYLWDDAFKFNTQDLFDSSFISLEAVIQHFIFSYRDERFSIFRQDIYDKLFDQD